MSPLINIITRVSRKNQFYRCYKSIHNQTYKNINHICTYQNDDMKEFLSHYDDITLQRVPDFKKIDGLKYSFNSNSVSDDFLNPDWEFLNKRANIDDNFLKDDTRFVEQKRFEKDFFWCVSLEHTFRKSFNHFPYNIYLKIAEKKIKDGWVYYLDDDDSFNDKNVLKKIVSEIQKHDEDTIHIIRVKLPNGKLSPSDKYWQYMKTGHPFVLNEIGGSNFIFHSKYVDYTAWDEWTGADYRTSKVLEKVIPKKNFIDITSVNISS